MSNLHRSLRLSVSIINHDHIVVLVKAVSIAYKSLTIPVAIQINRISFRLARIYYVMLESTVFADFF